METYPLPDSRHEVKKSESPVGQRSYRPEIDGLRGLAIAAVIINHFNPVSLTNGFLGVDIFFVISGFVITSSLEKRPARNWADFLLGFYSRRVKRLIPALVICVLVTAIAISLVNPDPGTSLLTGATALIGLSNRFLLQQQTDYFAVTTKLNPFTHTWSLGVEEQFYLLFPVLVWFSGFARRSPRGRLILAMLMGMLTIMSFVLFLKLYPINHPAAYFLMRTRFWEMGAGCLLALTIRASPRLHAWLARVPASLLLASILACLFLPFPLTGTVAIVILTALLIGSIQESSFVYGLLVHPWMLFIGLISYSLYLWHWSVLAISRWTIGVYWWTIPFQIVLIFLLAILSYRMVETPLRNAQWFEQRWQTITGAILVSLSGVATLALMNSALLGKLYLGKENRSPRYEDFLKSSVLDCSQIKEDETYTCRSTASNDAAPRIVVIGDSHSCHQLPLFESLSRLEGYQLSFRCSGGTLFPPQNTTHGHGRTRAVASRRRTDQETFFSENLAQLKSGDIIILSNRIENLFINDVFHPLFKQINYQSFDDQWRAIEPAAAFSQWLDRLSTLASAVAAKGVNVVIFSPLPVFPAQTEAGVLPAPVCSMQWFRPFQDPACPAGQVISRSVLLQRSQPLTKALEELATSHGNLHLFDPFPILCPGLHQSCTGTLDGTVIFSDGNHLTPAGSLLLYDPLKKLLGRLQEPVAHGSRAAAPQTALKLPQSQ